MNLLFQLVAILFWIFSVENLILAQQDLSSRYINDLESKALLPTATNEEIIEYEKTLLARKEANTVSDKERTNFLGTQLCHLGAKINPHHWTHEFLTAEWTKEMTELLRVETNPQTCAIFYDYFKQRWNPALIGWTLADFLKLNWAPTLMADEKYETLWKTATELGNRYLRGYTPLFPLKGVDLRHERIQHVFHLYVLYHATGLLPTNFQQIVEFGGGTGDNVATFREMNFIGTHFIIDLPPMLILQQYFNRFSNNPAYLGSRLPDGGGIGIRKTILESSMDLSKSFDKHINLELVNQTFFMATFSLNESPEPTRKVIFERVHNYGTLLLAFSKTYGRSILHDDEEMVKVAKSFSSTHNSCIWPIPFHYNNWYLVMRKGEPVKCSSKVGCTKQNLVYGSNCIMEN
jgi:hypothetical protein